MKINGMQRQCKRKDKNRLAMTVSRIWKMKTGEQGMCADMSAGYVAESRNECEVQAIGVRWEGDDAKGIKGQEVGKRLANG